jgi:hypothetical protein
VFPVSCSADARCRAQQSGIHSVGQDAGVGPQRVLPADDSGDGADSPTVKVIHTAWSVPTAATSK